MFETLVSEECARLDREGRLSDVQAAYRAVDDRVHDFLWRGLEGRSRAVLVRSLAAIAAACRKAADDLPN